MDKNFFEKVHEVVRLIPFGRVTSYGAIAKYLGSARSARMVGWALNKSGTMQPFVPAHRVVNRIGMLTGKIHFPNNKTMEEMLMTEGITVENDKVIKFEKYFWDPYVELI